MSNLSDVGLIPGMRVVVAGKSGQIIDIADKVKVKFDDGVFGFFDRSVVSPFVEDTRLKNVSFMHDHASGVDPLANGRY